MTYFVLTSLKTCEKFRLGCSPLRRELLRSPACDRSSVAEERHREGKCRKLGQHPLAEGKVLIRDRQAKPQCVGRGITNEQHPAFPWPQEGHLACTVARCVDHL